VRANGTVPDSFIRCLTGTSTVKEKRKGKGVKEQGAAGGQRSGSERRKGGSELTRACGAGERKVREKMRGQHECCANEDSARG